MIASARARAIGILGLWAVAAGLILVQLFMVLAAAAEYRDYAAAGLGGMPRVAADWWRVVGVLVPLGCVGIALWLQRQSACKWLRTLSRIAFVLLVPIGLLALLIASARGPNRLDSVVLPSGKRFVLALEPIPTDSVYTLYQPIGVFGVWWRQIANLDYSEDGRFIGDERIAVSPDGKWLAVARAGLWTDCFRLIRDKPSECSLTARPDWYHASYERDMRTRSGEIQRLTGMSPPR